MKTYDSIIKYGSLEDLGKEIKDHKSTGKMAIITDENVGSLLLDRVKSSLDAEGFDYLEVIIPPGEESKNGETYLAILNKLAEAELTRSDGIIALGGGVVGDLAGFAAATYLRGVDYYQVPTTLLAMVDSSIGGKTGIDLDYGKNLAGAFYFPGFVFTDITLLKTLPFIEMKNGMAEIIKYGIMEGGSLWKDINENWDTKLKDIIIRCQEIKTRIVKNDPLDKGERKLLNLGHTLGHGIEKLSNYEVKHGFAVAMGIYEITSIASKKNWCSKERAEEIIKCLEKRPFKFEKNTAYSKDSLYEAIKTDKKRRGDSIDIIVPVEIGKCEIKTISMDELKELLNE